MLKWIIIGRTEWPNCVCPSASPEFVFGTASASCFRENPIIAVLAGMYFWATIAQFSLTDVPPLIRGGSVCLSWLLEPSLSVKVNPYFLIGSDLMKKKKKKNAITTPKWCLLLYISHHAFCLCQLSVLFPGWDLVFAVLPSFTFLWLPFENKTYSKQQVWIFHRCGGASTVRYQERYIYFF